MPPSRRTTAIRLALAVLVSAGLLGVVLSRLDRGAASRLLEVDGRLVALAFGLSVLTLVLRGVRLTLLVPAGAGLVVPSVAVQTFLLRVTPLRLGELAFPWLLHRHGGVDPARSVVALVLVRLLDLLVILALAAGAGLLLAGSRSGALLVALGLAAVLLTLPVSLRLGATALAGAARFLGLARLPRVERALVRLLAAATDAADLPASRLTALVALTLVILVAQTALLGLLLLSLDVHASVLAVALGASAAQLAQAVPVGAVGSLGTLEAGWAAGFTAAGVGLSDAVLTGVAAQVWTLLFSAALALPAVRLLPTRLARTDLRLK